MSSFIKVKIENVLKDLNNKITFLQPLYEAISNSLEANASNIDIIFEKEELLDIGKEPKITGFTIIDDGDGFTNENIESFKEYLSQYKKDLGCKGIGRFTWLKVFNDINIDSFTGNNHIKIPFNINFSEDNIITSPSFDNKKTSITFNNITDKYYKESQTNPIDKRCKADIEDIKNNILTHLLVKLFLLKEEKNRKFNITLNLDSKKISISDKDIIELKKKEFSIEQENLTYDFNLYYNLKKEDNNKRNLFYCADGRVVDKFPDTLKIGKLPDNSSIIMLLTSKYFDERINNERNEFTFSMTENNPSIDAPITFQMINSKLKTNIDNIIIEYEPTVKDKNDEIIEDCINENPHLAKYIRNNTELGIIYDKNDVLKTANKLFSAEKTQVLNTFKNLLDKNNLSSENFSESVSKLNDISNRELAQYILYRQYILDGLNKLIVDNDKREELLHKIFMEKGTETDNHNLYNTNIWILDDKFMTYTKMFSDTKISKMKQELSIENPDIYGDGKEPDLTMFYTDLKDNIKDVVVVELKGIGVNADRKLVSIPEINRNLGYIAKNLDENINNLYGYIITNLDEKTQSDLECQQGINKCFSNGDTPIYYYFNNNIRNKNDEKIPCHVYILSIDSIQRDAESRNSLFLNIIKNQN